VITIKKVDQEGLAEKLAGHIRGMIERGTRVSIMKHDILTPATIAQGAELAGVRSDVVTCSQCQESYSIVRVQPRFLGSFLCTCGEIVYI